MTQTEKLREWIAEQIYGGYCEPEDRDGLDWQGVLSNADQILKASKEAGLRFVGNKGDVLFGEEIEI